MTVKPNEQYNVAAPDSLAVRIASRVRNRMFSRFMAEFRPNSTESVLDIGVTSDKNYQYSNYFEELYPFKDKITAGGLDDASFLEHDYPGLRFIKCNVLQLPFADRAFDWVHSAAVLEHVGSFAHQYRAVAECLRVARRGIFLTTPNRWFPIELHTQLPLLHWLPTPVYRKLLSRIGFEFFAREENLNLLSGRRLRGAAGGRNDWSFRVGSARLLGLTSNLLLIGRITEGHSGRSTSPVETPLAVDPSGGQVDTPGLRQTPARD